MKWPEALWFIRHGQSAYNVHRDHKLQDPEYREFQAQFEADCRSLRTRELAQKMWERYALHFGDWNTPLTDEGRRQARTVGAALPQAVALPDVLFVSPHDRTWQTLRALTEGWPALADVKTVEEPRLHEQDHGIAIVYNDWRIFHALEPIQKMLYDQSGAYWYRYPQGENVPDVIERARSFIDTLIRDYAEKKVGVITHHLTLLSSMAATGRVYLQRPVGQVRGPGAVLVAAGALAHGQAQDAPLQPLPCRRHHRLVNT
jgi:broad specificity phosphatase PhoE